MEPRTPDFTAKWGDFNSTTVEFTPETSEARAHVRDLYGPAATSFTVKISHADRCCDILRDNGFTVGDASIVRCGR